MNQDMALLCINEQGALGDGGWLQVREGGEGIRSRGWEYMAAETSF